jgi:hypothetical protein
MGMKIPLVLAAGLVLVILIGCSVQRADVVGTYHLNNAPNISATLQIHQDGTYAQRITVGDQAPITHEGRWSFQPKSDNPLRLVDAYSIRCEAACEVVPHQGVAFPIEGHSRLLVLSVDGDKGIGYMKD